MFEIRHQVPGRLRLHLPALRADPAFARSLPGQLRGCDGVQSVRTNPSCASLVITHDPYRLSAERLQERLVALLAATASAPSLVAPLPVQPPPVQSHIAVQPGSQRRAQGGWLGLPNRMRLKRPNWLRDWAAVLQHWRAQFIPATKVEVACTSQRAPSPSVALICRANLRLSRWMLVQTLSCWWHGELASDHGRAGGPARK